MARSIASLAPDHPDIKTVYGRCGHTIRTVTERYPELLAGTAQVRLHCKVCEASVIVDAIHADKPRYCTSARCARPDVPLSRYNADPAGRCNACYLREQDAWLERLRNPGLEERDRIRDALKEGAKSAPELEQMANVPVHKIYNHLLELIAAGEVKKVDRKSRHAIYALSTDVLAVAA